MRLFPSELMIDDYEGFTPEKDLFARRKFGEGLGNLFANVEDTMVAVLDAPWGSGKTTFVKMWCGYMRNRGFPVIYFDAFKNDYTDDAFLALAGEVIALADEVGPIDGDARNGFLLKAQKVAWAAAKGGFKKGLSKLLGDEGVQEVTAAVAEEGANSVLDSVDVYLRDKLEGRKKERNAFNEFGHALEVLSVELSKAMQARATTENNGEEGEEVANGSVQRPLIFVIDELDRCKPPFALDLLEKVKHFFSVSHVQFLLVTHMEQLENSVRFAYGMDGQAGTYLQKFYHVVLGLPTETKVSGITNVERYLDKLFAELPNDGENGQYADDLREIILSYTKHHGITFRSLERVATQIGIFLASTSKGNLRLSPLAATLCLMKTVTPNLYKKAQAKTITLDDVCNFMVFDESERFGAMCKTWWGFCIGDDKYYEANKIEMVRLVDSSNFNRFRDRHDIVPTICSLIDRLNFVSK